MSCGSPVTSALDVLCLGQEGAWLSRSCPSTQGGKRQTQALFWQKLPFHKQGFSHSCYPFLEVQEAKASGNLKHQISS